MYERTRRLKQVATTLNIGTSTIVNYLAEKGIEIENKPTTRITGEQFEMLAKAFAFAMQEKVEADELNINNKTKGKSARLHDLEGTNEVLELRVKCHSKATISCAPVHKEYKVADFFTNDTPNILYKYRCWGEGFLYHQRMILENELFFSSPARFNDPFDVSIPFRFDLLSIDEKKHYCLELASQLYPNLSLTNRKRKALEIEESSLFSEGASVRALKEIRNNVGIVSLSKNRSNILMWSHYADSHRGFCVGFNTERLLQEVQCRLDEVLYSQDYPVLKYVLSQDEEVQKQLITKSSLWEYEEEYRLIKANFPNKTIKLSDDVFEEVILGCQMPSGQKNYLKSIIKKKYKKVKVFEATQDQNQFKLSFIKV